VPLLDQRTLSVVRTLVICVLIGAFFYAARNTIFVLIFAAFFAYLIDPIVTRVEHWPRISMGSRALAIAEVYLVLAMACTGIVLGVGPSIALEGRHLLSAAPELLDHFTWGKIIRQISSTHGWSYHTQLEIEHLVALHRAAILSAIQSAAVKVEGLVTNIFWFALVPILAIFLLKSGREFAESGINILRLRPRRRMFLKATLRDINDMAAHFIRAQVLLAALSLPVYTVVLVISGLQYGLFLGLFAGALEFVPLVGPLVAAIAILGVAFVTGFPYIWVLMVFLIAWRVVQDYVNSPRLMHRSVKLHPFAVIIAVLAGGEIGGILGVFLSIPVAATLQIFWRRWRTSSFTLTGDLEHVDTPEHRAA